jgi:hypothetical protein
MISDKPRRFRPSDCVTPVDPMTNSFMGSIKVSHSTTNARLKENANRIMREKEVAAAASQFDIDSNPALVEISKSGNVNPYGSHE